MKKIMTTISLIAFVFILTACSKITTEDLKANQWYMTSKDDSANVIVSFSDHVMTLKPDLDSIPSTAENEFEKIGEEFGKQLFKDIDFKLEYELKGNTAKIQDVETKEFVEYTIKKDGDKLIFTPTDSYKKEGKESFELEKYMPKKKTKTSSTSSKESSSETVSSKKEEVSSESASINESTEQSSENIEQPVATIDDFYGLWGVPNSGNLIQVNQDYTVTTIDGSTIPMINTTFSLNASGQPVMSFNLNGTPKRMTLLSDNQLSADGTTYAFQGHITMNELSARNNAQAATQQESTSQSQTTTTVLQGESPEQIASRSGISVDQLLALNGMTKIDYFFAPGQQVRIK